MPYSIDPNSYPEIYETLFESALTTPSGLTVTRRTPGEAYTLQQKLYAFRRALSHGTPIQQAAARRYRALAITKTGVTVSLLPHSKTAEYEDIINAIASSSPTPPPSPLPTIDPSPLTPLTPDDPKDPDDDLDLDSILGPKE